MKLDLQPFTLLPPPQVFLAENLHNPSSKNRAFARFLERTYEKLHDERSVTRSVRLPWTLPLLPDCLGDTPKNPSQTGRAAVKLDLQPFMPLPPSQVFAQAVAIFI